MLKTNSHVLQTCTTHRLVTDYIYLQPQNQKLKLKIPHQIMRYGPLPEKEKENKREYFSSKCDVTLLYQILIDNPRGAGTSPVQLCPCALDQHGQPASRCHSNPGHTILAAGHQHEVYKSRVNVKIIMKASNTFSPSSVSSNVYLLACQPKG